MLELSRGANFDFLTMGVAIDTLQDGGELDANDGRADDGIGGEKKGIATGLGRVMGKFVATPDWEKLL